MQSVFESSIVSKAEDRGYNKDIPMTGTIRIPYASYRVASCDILYYSITFNKIFYSILSYLILSHSPRAFPAPAYHSLPDADSPTAGRSSCTLLSLFGPLSTRAFLATLDTPKQAANPVQMRIARLSGLKTDTQSGSNIRMAKIDCKNSRMFSESYMTMVIIMIIMIMVLHLSL